MSIKIWTNIKPLFWNLKSLCVGKSELFKFKLLLIQVYSIKLILKLVADVEIKNEKWVVLFYWLRNNVKIT